MRGFGGRFQVLPLVCVASARPGDDDRAAILRSSLGLDGGRLASPPTMELTVIRADDSVTHLAILGNLDIQGVNEIQDRFVFNTAARRKATLVDLSQVTFI